MVRGRGTGAEKVSRCLPTGLSSLKRRSVSSSRASFHQGEEVASYLFHAHGTNPQFSPGEFNCQDSKARHGTKEVFRLRDEHFQVQEPH